MERWIVPPASGTRGLRCGTLGVSAVALDPAPPRLRGSWSFVGPSERNVSTLGSVTSSKARFIGSMGGGAGKNWSESLDRYYGRRRSWPGTVAGGSVAPLQTIARRRRTLFVCSGHRQYALRAR